MKPKSRFRIASAARICALPLYCAGATAWAQIAPPVLEVDFTTVTLPLSPLLSVAIAVGIAAVAAVALRHTRGHTRLLSWLMITLAALPLAHALSGTRLISDAHAVPQPTLPLTVSPVIVTGTTYFDYIKTINVTGSPLTIVAVKYNTGGYDFYIDTANTTCVPGLALAPGAFCYIRILSLG